MIELLTSAQNPRIKQFLQLTEKSRERNKLGLFVAEGRKEIGIALRSGYRIKELFVCLSIWEGLNGAKGDPLPTADKTWAISEAIFEKLAYRKTTDGLLAIAYQGDLGLNHLSLSDNPFVIVLESVEKPGNLGAILRTADAVGADAVIVCDRHTDVYNPNVVRSSLGCLFSVPVAICSSEEAFAWLEAKGIRILAAELQASIWYHETDMRVPTAIVMGTEAYGLTPYWIEHAHQRVKIPMLEQVDSLNVSISTTILTYEAKRQRGFK